MLISVCIVAYNEEKTLPRLLWDIEQQDYPKNKMEILLIDSMSSDATRKIMKEFQEKSQEFWAVQVLENQGRKQASGWNVALKNYRGEAILRIDAHAEIPQDFVRKNVRVLEEGECVSGGPRPNIIDDQTPWKETLLLAEQSMFGSSIAPYRRNGEKTYVKSVFHGAYTREVFDKIGCFNEKLGRTEDNEIHYRIRKAGYKICYSPDILSYQHTRSTLKSMLKQKYGNGYWVALTLKVCPKCLSIYHFVPFFFVVAIIITSLLWGFGYPALAYLMWGMYWSLAIIMALISVKGKKKSIYQVLLPGLFFVLHVSYGIGSVAGMIKMPFCDLKND